MNRLTGGHFTSYGRQYLDSLPVLSRCIDYLCNGLSGITLREVRLLLKTATLNREDGIVADANVDQLVKLTKVPFDKFKAQKLYGGEELIGKDGLLVRNSFVLDEYQQQMLTLQKAVGAMQQKDAEKKLEEQKKRK